MDSLLRTLRELEIEHGREAAFNYAMAVLLVPTRENAEILLEKAWLEIAY